MTLTIKLDRNWSSFQLANSTPPLSVTGSAIAPSARMPHSMVILLDHVCAKQQLTRQQKRNTHEGLSRANKTVSCSRPWGPTVLIHFTTALLCRSWLLLRTSSCDPFGTPAIPHSPILFNKNRRRRKTRGGGEMLQIASSRGLIQHITRVAATFAKSAKFVRFYDGVKKKRTVRKK